MGCVGEVSIQARMRKKGKMCRGRLFETEDFGRRFAVRRKRKLRIQDRFIVRVFVDPMCDHTAPEARRILFKE